LQLNIEASKIALSINEKDIAGFVLKNPLKLKPLLLSLVAHQLKFNQNLVQKVPSWPLPKGILAPPDISFEQSSSETTARYKSSLFQGNNVLDLTGGFGIDTYFYSKEFGSIVHNEPNLELSQIVKYNFEILGVNNVEFANFKAEDFPFSLQYDLIYLDPSRRNSQNKKLFKIQDCMPDLMQMSDRFWSASDNFLVKYSPILDISEAIRLLSGVYKVIIIAEKNEVKELLFLLKKSFEPDVLISCINIIEEETVQYFDFNLKEEKECETPTFTEPQSFLYEPNAAIMKAGAFKSIAKQFDLKKLAINTHLYTSEKPVVNFPGKIFKIEKVLKFDPKLIKERFNKGIVNVISRNFPYSTNEIKQKLRLKDGGTETVFFTEDLQKRKISIICEKI
jgi:hypothetical protein